jgi:hypothetical protein
VFLPCCLKKQEDGCYVLLNREYKPVGSLTSESINYAGLGKLKITKALAQKLTDYEHSRIEQIFLYNDSTNPVLSKRDMDDYLAKLALLAKLRIA